MARYVALFRGINVGKAKRIAMADLRTLLEKLGYTGVKTLLSHHHNALDQDMYDVVLVDPERNLLGVHGAVPGGKGGLVVIKEARKQ